MSDTAQHLHSKRSTCIECMCYSQCEYDACTCQITADVLRGASSSSFRASEQPLQLKAACWNNNSDGRRFGLLDHRSCCRGRRAIFISALAVLSLQQDSMWSGVGISTHRLISRSTSQHMTLKQHMANLALAHGIWHLLVQVSTVGKVFDKWCSTKLLIEA